MKTITLIFILIVSVSCVAAQTTAFNFQGRLNDGTNPASGSYSLVFKLFDSLQGGTQVGPTNDRPAMTLVNGVFSTSLDFGADAFTGGNRFIEIGVRPAGSPNQYVILGPRQQIMSVPQAVRSLNATNADNAANAQNAVNATNSQNALSLGGIAANQYARLSFANQGDLVGANIGSNGYLSVQSNAFQPISSNGFPKMMLAITGDGTIARCYNGVTGVSTNNCGVSVFMSGNSFDVTLPFNILDRFWLVSVDASTAGGSPPWRAGNAVPLTPGNRLNVATYEDGSRIPRPFHLFIF